MRCLVQSNTLWNAQNNFRQILKLVRNSFKIFKNYTGCIDTQDGCIDTLSSLEYRYIRSDVSIHRYKRGAAMAAVQVWEGHDLSI